jgi:hypothetical protein
VHTTFLRDNEELYARARFLLVLISEQLTWALSGGCAKCRSNAANRSIPIQKARAGTGAAVRFSAMLAHAVCLCMQASRFALAIVPSNLAFSNQISSLLCCFASWYFIKLAQAGAQRFDASTMFDSRHFGSLPTASSIARTICFKDISFIALVQDSCLLCIGLSEQPL